MRAISKDFGNPPPRLLKNNLPKVILGIENINRSIYSDDSVKLALKALYLEKCAYCECYEPEPEIEHYRPHGKLTGSGVGHKGYVWLCYEWSNLVWSCHDCNKQGKKGNEFPVEGTRITSPVMLATGNINLAENLLNSTSLSNEKALLVNPEYPGYDPKDFFYFDGFGELKPKGSVTSYKYRMASETIITLELNRDKLFLNLRKRKVKYYMKRLEIILYRYIVDNNVNRYEEDFRNLLLEIKDLTDVTCEYWYFWNYFLDNFKTFIPTYFNMIYVVGINRTFDNLKTQI